MLRALLLLGLLACANVFSASTPDVNEGAEEAPIKAAMVFKFLSYTEWPTAAFATQDSPYRISVLGDREIATALRAITKNRLVNGRPIEITMATSPSVGSAPHVIILGLEANKYLKNVRRMARQDGVLVITENPDGIDAGSMINLRVVDGRVGFDVSLIDAQRANIQLSARLLSVALTIKKVRD